MFLKVFALIAWAAYCQACDNSTIISVIDITEDTQKLIEYLHNDVRKAISNGTFCGQPKGNSLREITYDEDLEDSALPLLLTCDFIHVLAEDPRWSRCGQNIYKKNFPNYDESYKVDWGVAVKAWADECHSFTYPDKSAGVTGHYTQLAWAETYTVGCGAIIFQKNEGGYSLFIVCNYGPGGNTKGQVPYAVGDGGCNGLCKNDGTWE